MKDPAEPRARFYAMQPHHLAQIGIRVLALFMVWRAVEFGVGQLISMEVQFRILAPVKEAEMLTAIQMVRWMTIGSVVFPAVLAAVLWMLAPALARYMVDRGERTEPAADGRMPSLRSALVHVAGIVFVGTALVGLPKMIFEFKAEEKRDKTITMWNSRVFPDAILCLSKFAVGAALMIAVKPRLQPVGEREPEG